MSAPISHCSEAIEASACPQRSEDSHSPQYDQSARQAASAQIDQVEGTIPEIYQVYKRDLAALWEMVMEAEDPKQRDALMSGVSAIKTLLLDRGYDA